MSRSDSESKFRTAVSFHQAGKLETAAELYRQIISADPKNFYALHYLGILEAARGNDEQAKNLLDRSLLLQPANLEFVENYATVSFQKEDYRSALAIAKHGLQYDNTNTPLIYVCAISLFRMKQFQESLAYFDKLLILAPKHIAANNERGAVLAEMKYYDAALESFEKALMLRQQYPEAHLNKGSVFGALRRYDEALVAYDKALALKPDLADAWVGRGNVLVSREQYDGASLAYDKALALKPDLADAWLGRGNVLVAGEQYDGASLAYDKALALKPDFAEAWLGRGNMLVEMRRFAEALLAYRKALELKDDLAQAWLGLGNVCLSLKDYDKAFVASDRAVALRPDIAEVWLARGNIFAEINRHDEALSAYDRAIALKSHFSKAWYGRANVLVQLQQYEKALAAYDAALRYEPDLRHAKGGLVYVKLHLSDWINFDAEISDLVSSVRAKKPAILPFQFLPIASSAADQLQCAQTFMADQPYFPPVWGGDIYSHNRIRIAYLSADFRNHAVGFLTAGLFESHDKSRFEITAISIGPAPDSPLRRRLKNAFESFVDVRDKTDAEIAKLVRDREIDIAVDLMGHTRYSRLGILARRPAPVQVHYLGFAGTLGTSFIDYLIADSTVVPEDHQTFYTEKVIYLPDSYFVADNRRPISSRTPTREECGLPEDGFVFCSFNDAYKITPKMFEVWMRLLRGTPNSVLWLSQLHPIAMANLRREAEQHGVPGRRLIFSQKVVENADHLARQRQADLFLDTLPYNAHTTASDALWAGLPVLTCLGEVFAGRVAASQLKSVGLSELVTTSLEDYEALALRLAREPALLAVIKAKLARNRDSHPLFDTARFTRHVEAAYTIMWGRFQRGEAPAAFAVNRMPKPTDDDTAEMQIIGPDRSGDSWR